MSYVHIFVDVVWEIAAPSIIPLDSGDGTNSYALLYP